MNAICSTCGHRGERGLDVVIYRVAICNATPGMVMLCEDCACVFEDCGAGLDRLVDQSGTPTMEAA